MSHTHSLSLRISFLGKRHSCKLKNNMTCKYCERQKPRGCGSREEALTLTWRQSRAKGRKEYGMRSFQKKIMSAEGEKEQRCKGVVSDRCRETQAEIRQKAPQLTCRAQCWGNQADSFQMSKLASTWHWGDQDLLAGVQEKGEESLGPIQRKPRLTVEASHIISSTLYQIHNLVSRALCTRVWVQSSS